MDLRPVSEWREELSVVLKSKQAEFDMLGYQEITEDAIWRCLVEYIWKEDKQLHLYEVVQAIFQLQIHTYMDFLSLDSLTNQVKDKDEDLMASINAVMNPNQAD